MFTKVKFIFIITVLCLSIPFSVLANKPEKGEYSDFFLAEPLIDCGDYWILDDYVLDLFWIDFFDNEGNWIREFDNYSFFDDLYREGKPIHSSGKSEFHVQAYFENDEWVYEQLQGIFTQITVPGYGNMLVDTGRFMRDADGFYFEKGQLVGDGEFDERIEALCDYLRQE